MTTLAPVPGRDTDPDVEPGTGASASTATAGSGKATPSGADVTIGLSRRAPRAAATNQPALASWLFGLALALLSEGAAERVAMAEVLAEAAGRSGALEGAYGRGVALLNEFPGDPLVRRTVDLLAKAVLRSRRPARAAEE